MPVCVHLEQQLHLQTLYFWKPLNPIQFKKKFLKNLKCVAQCWWVTKNEGVNKPHKQHASFGSTAASRQHLLAFKEDGCINKIFSISAMDNHDHHNVLSCITAAAYLFTIYNKNLDNAISILKIRIALIVWREKKYIVNFHD